MERRTGSGLDTLLPVPAGTFEEATTAACQNFMLSYIIKDIIIFYRR